MQPRIEQELALLRRYYPDLVWRDEGQWILLPRCSLPANWSAQEVPICFQVPPGYAGTPPYGFHVPASLAFDGNALQNATNPSKTPFDGTWQMLSWTHLDDWRPTANLETGSNLWGWCRGFAERFRSGR